ncbi:thymidine kinase [Ornithinimicrobium sp. F0845]|uniref:thymidine kinase n=1 Tax=Ornithinimicrobium sp. F0845 TaxID=2926412 RepID=UPI001FF33549|nr:thymidine kinase [Ornithinimicrobium sp. F0845]MCK0111924.1 thymidine kinase [Ornithinimicrobium sp. F0845]
MKPAPVRGHVEVICGPMFAGKTEELLRRVRRARLAGLDVEVVNHALDDRRGPGMVSSHDGISEASRTAPDATGIGRLLEGRSPDIVAIDEAQFFGPDLVPVVDALAGNGMTVVVAGLSVTFDGRPFEPLPSLMATAEKVTRLTAVCAVCGGEAAFHQRVDPGAPADALTPVAEHVGGVETYQARCRHHRG